MGQPNGNLPALDLSARILAALSEVSGLRLESPCMPAPHSVVDGVRKLSAQFNRGEGVVTHPYLNDVALRSAYLAYFVPVNLVKVQILLNEITQSISDLSQKLTRVLDVGEGRELEPWRYWIGWTALMMLARERLSTPSSTIPARHSQSMSECGAVIRANGFLVRVNV